ncbi:MAG TPA: hypothetical protein VFJ51_09560 [Nitrososphaeraceae archaeon]|nr:hypothetical protein [Nitrososphaeraceae archaeon]
MSLRKTKKRTQFTDLEKEAKALLDTEFDLSKDISYYYNNRSSAC